MCWAGWAGGCCSGSGRRINLQHTRAIVDAIHSGELAAADCSDTPFFHLQVGVQGAGGSAGNCTCVHKLTAWPCGVSIRHAHFFRLACMPRCAQLCADYDSACTPWHLRNGSSVINRHAVCCSVCSLGIWLGRCPPHAQESPAPCCSRSTCGRTKHSTPAPWPTWLSSFVGTLPAWWPAAAAAAATAGAGSWLGRGSWIP